jgi:hypothetical protein
VGALAAGFVDSDIEPDVDEHAVSARAVAASRPAATSEALVCRRVVDRMVFSF